jgi:hypothetical protein
MVYKFVRTCAYLSMEEVVHLLKDGNLQHVPNITHADVMHGFKMYGSPAEYG